MATSTKTIRNRIIRRPGLEGWYDTTRELYNRVVQFYFELYEAHPTLADMSTDDALKQVETLTHQTEKNPNPPFPLHEAVAPGIPAMLRRAAIRAARGAYKSCRSNYQNWLKAKAKHEEKNWRRKKPKPFRKRPPVPPRNFNFNVNFYSGMSKERTADSIMLKFWTGKSWQWTKVRFGGRQVPFGLEAKSPTLVKKPGGYLMLHTPVKKKFKSPGKIIEIGGVNRNLVICAVDRNLDGTAAVAVIMRADGKVLTRKHIKLSGKLQHRRKRYLGIIAKKRGLTGSLAADEQDNVKLWRKIRNIDRQLSHLVSRRLVDFAAEFSVQVIVFEHLAKLKPQKGRYSKRSNEKRNYWLKGRVFQQVKYKAWELGILVSRVNPRNTSRDCHRCGHRPVARYRPPEAPVDYQTGTPLYICPECLSRGNADENAAINIGLRFFQRLYQHLSKDAETDSPRVALHKDVSQRLESLRQVQGDGQALPTLSLAKLRCAVNGRAYGSRTNGNVYATVGYKKPPASLAQSARTV